MQCCHSVLQSYKKIFTQMKMILILFGWVFHELSVDGFSTKTLYLVSENGVKNQKISRQNCRNLGGNSINLESPFTDIFLDKFQEVLDPVGRDQRLYYTGLRYHLTTRTFFWDDENCTLASEEIVETLSSGLESRTRKSFQILYVPGTFGSLGENFDGYWSKPATGRNRVICELDTADECGFVEQTKVLINSTSEVKVFAEDPDTCKEHCLNIESDLDECWMYHYDDGNCSLWYGDKYRHLDSLIYDDVDGITVYYKDCVDVQFFLADDNIRASDLKCTTSSDSDSDTVVENTVGDQLQESHSTNSNDLIASMSTQNTADIIEVSTGSVGTSGSQAITMDPINRDHQIAAIRTQTLSDEQKVTRSTDGFTNMGTEASFITEGQEQVTDLIKRLPVTTDSSGLESVLRCLCVCPKGSNDSMEEKEGFTRDILTNLTIDIQNTSANTRRYISATDNRPSAISIGGFGAIFLGVTLSIPVLLDLSTLVYFIIKVIQKSRGRTNVTRINIRPIKQDQT